MCFHLLKIYGPDLKRVHPFTQIPFSQMEASADQSIVFDRPCDVHGETDKRCLVGGEQLLLPESTAFSRIKHVGQCYLLFHVVPS